jgi:hypothetical protein
MNGKSDKGYKVGYGKPPKATRFKKGTSGNPSGRPRKAPLLLDPGSIIEAIDNEEIQVSDNGKRKRMTKAEIEFRQLFTKAIRGDLSAARLVVNQAADHLAPEIRGDFDYEFIGETEAKQRFGRKSQDRIQELNMSRGYQR